MAEQISLICPECSTKLRLNVAGQDLTGKQVKCPKCSKRFAADQALSEPEAPLIHSSDAFEEDRPVLGTAAANVEPLNWGEVDSKYHRMITGPMAAASNHDHRLPEADLLPGWDSA